MKKTLFFIMILAVLATGCNRKKKSKDLNYNDSNPIEMVLRGNHQIKAESDYDISYKAINPSNATVIEVSGGGNIYGKNVGSAQVKMDNGYENLTVDVIVDLFRQPTFEFGCNSERIRQLYGRPFNSAIIDTLLIYQYTASQGYSYACGEMDFFFYNGAYYEADVYIRPSVDYLLNNYISENFNYHSTVGDTLDIYKYKNDTTIICGKFDSHNQWNEFCLFYYRSNATNSLDKALKALPRSSKLRY